MRARSHRFPDDNDIYTDTTYYDDCDKYLDIGYQRLKRITLSCSQYNIKKLYAEHNSLTSLPRPTELPQLEELSCSYNKLDNLPFYPNLTFLNISHNRISDLIAYRNSKLKYLDCSNNLNLNINFTLPSCEQLYITDNGISQIDLSKLPRLQLLDCSNNQFESIEGGNQLTELNIQYNKVKLLPKWQFLKHLVADHNKLVSLPSYPSLLTLSINHNQLNTLASQPKLTDLIAHHNYITEIGDMPSATLIDLSHNSLRQFSVPSNIKFLSCQFNPISDLIFSSDILSKINELQISFDLYERLYKKYYDNFDFANIELDQQKLSSLLRKLNVVFDDKIVNYINTKFEKMKFTKREKMFPLIVLWVYVHYFKNNKMDIQEILQTEKFKILYEGICKVYYKCLVVTMYFNDYE